MLVLPGYMFLVVFRFCGNGKHENVNPISVESLIATYIIILAYSAIKSVIRGLCDLSHVDMYVPLIMEFLKNLSHNNVSDTIILLVFSASIGALLGCLLTSQSVKAFVEKHLKVSMYANPWVEMPNGKLGDYVDVHLDGKSLCYRGWLNTHFEYNGETWIVIGDYIQIDPHTKQGLEDAGCNIDSKKEFIQSPQIMINLKDVTRVEFLGISKDVSD